MESFKPNVRSAVKERAHGIKCVWLVSFTLKLTVMSKQCYIICVDLQMGAHQMLQLSLHLNRLSSSHI